ncbi:hypothetical protein UA08_03897 [Talaromyces atroroseus]|uniref:AA1-like domain-containing protein n=1 Tax=Talaromyces atroroseus TaxID=1441469 RepID=A0A225APL4_TALAT|nr:hypothetical protein UA08_03897 [Talaromyces atroroseus]OKL61433.1 hypothetical protein UA08_03897 [Talaromyces atroroseus]
MKSFATLSALLVGAATVQPCLASVYGYYTFQAFSGSECDGDAGAVDRFPSPSGDTKYIDFTGRHSFYATLVDGNDGGEFLAYATPCVDDGCDDSLYQYEFEIDESGCANVNTGGAVNGFALFTTFNGI